MTVSLLTDSAVGALGEPSDAQSICDLRAIRKLNRVIIIISLSIY